MTGQQIGDLIGVIAGGIWALAGSTVLSGRSRAIAVVVSLAATILLGLAIGRLPSAGMADHPGRFDGGIYALAVGAEMIAILAAVALLHRLARQDWLPPVIAVIVGLHFLGLWRATGEVACVALAAGLCLVGFAGLWVPASVRLLVVGFGAALVLWAPAVVTILSS